MSVPSWSFYFVDAGDPVEISQDMVCADARPSKSLLPLPVTHGQKVLMTHFR